MSANLQKAIECLDIRDVFLWESKCSLAEGLDPKYMNAEDFESQLRHNVSRGEVMSLNISENEELHIFRVSINFGARWVVEEDGDNGEDVNVRAEIEASFISEYTMKNDPGQEALNEYAIKNAIYHVWPYWREYLMSQSTRMNLPKAVLPAVQFCGNAQRQEEAGHNSE